MQSNTKAGFSPKGVREVQHHSDGPIFLSCDVF